jgi:amino-acid N-acetyltransferase
MNITIRAARTSDIPQLVKLIDPFVESGNVLRRTYQELGELLPNFFVAVLENVPDGSDGAGEIVGCAALEIYSRKLAEVRSLAVARKVQGQGIGRRLVSVCVERARIHDILEVMAITTADDFFMKCGFDYSLPGAKRALFVQTRETKDAMHPTAETQAVPTDSSEQSP